MKLDRDGVLSILLGLVLIGVSWFVEYKFFVGDVTGAILALVKDIILGGIAGVGILLIIVGLLFILAW